MNREKIRYYFELEQTNGVYAVSFFVVTVSFDVSECFFNASRCAAVVLDSIRDVLKRMDKPFDRFSYQVSWNDAQDIYIATTKDDLSKSGRGKTMASALENLYLLLQGVAPSEDKASGNNSRDN